MARACSFHRSWQFLVVWPTQVDLLEQVQVYLYMPLFLLGTGRVLLRLQRISFSLGAYETVVLMFDFEDTFQLGADFRYIGDVNAHFTGSLSLTFPSLLSLSLSSHCPISPRFPHCFSFPLHLPLSLLLSLQPLMMVRQFLTKNSCKFTLFIGIVRLHKAINSPKLNLI